MRRVLVISLATAVGLLFYHSGYWPRPSSPPPDLSKFEYHVRCWDIKSSKPQVRQDVYQLYSDNNAEYNEQVWHTTIISDGSEFMEYTSYFRDKKGALDRKLFVKNGGALKQIETAEEYKNLFRQHIPPHLTYKGSLMIDDEHFTCARVFHAKL